VEASSSGNATVTIPATTAPGSYYLIAEADGGHAVAEFAETNNARARSIRIGADLVVSAFSAPATAGAGVVIQVSETTTNQGTGGAGASSTRFYLSTNAQLDTADAALGSRVVPALEPGAGNPATTPLTIPAGTATGAYYLLAAADADHTVPEMLESNNQTARLIQIGGDMRISALTAPAAAGPGSSIVIGDTTANGGSGAIGPTTTRYYFSSNGVLDGQDVVLGSRQVPSLDAGASHTGAATVTLPAAIAPGTYYIIAKPELGPGAGSGGSTLLTVPGTIGTGTYYLFAKADGDGRILETQESNNAALRSILIGADLVVSSLTVPAKGEAGATISVIETTSNQGGGVALASTTAFSLSEDLRLDSGA